MAKNTKSRNIEAIKAELESNQAMNASLRHQLDVLADIEARGRTLTEQQKLMRQEAEKSIAIEERRRGIVDRWNKSLANAAQSLEDISEYQSIINEAYGKGSQLAAVQNQQLEIAKSFQQSIAAEIEHGNIENERGKEILSQISAAYGNMQIGIMNADKALTAGEITMERRNELVEEEAKKYARIAASAEDIAGLSQEALDAVQQSAQQASALEKAMSSAAVKSSLMDKAMSEVEGSLGPIGPALGSINNLLKTNINDTKAWTVALFAVGAALGKAAMDYFGAPMKAALQSDKERAQNRIDTEANVAKLQTDAQFIPKQIEQERLEARINAEGDIARLQQEAAFAGAKAAIQFSAQMQQGAAQFERAAKTALFGNKIGSVGYGAAQLQLAGIGAEKVASGMEAAADATGRMPSAKVGADMAIMAERTGTSVDNIASINEMFQRMDGVSESTAMNLSEGLRNMADQAKIGLGALMREIADASKDALSYQIKSGPALAKQVAYAKSIGVSFGDVAKAGKSMVMNYKDSIKQEMQLSAMLGKNVDLSEVRAKFASGDTSGALESLKAQGLDPAQMDMFAQDALSQALGGMDLNSLQKIATKGGAQVGGLKEGNAKGGNQDFLSRTQAAESQMAMTQASISANTAVLDAQLSQKIADSYLASGDYKTLKENQNKAAIEAENLSGSMKDAWLKTDAYKDSISKTAQLDFISSIKQGFLGLVGALGGGILTTLAGSGLGKIKGMFSGLGGGGASTTPTAAASPMGGGGPGAAPGGAPGGGGAPGAGIGQKMVDGMKQASTVIKGIVKELSGVLKSIISELSGVLQQGVKLVTDVSNKIAEGVMKTFNTVVGGLKTASAQMPAILGNLGKAIGSFFSGMTAGLTTFAQAMAAPTPLFGLPVGLIVVGMAMGLAKAFSIAGPGIEALTPLLLGLAEIIGGTFVKVLQEVAPIITAIFDGIAKVITAVGDAISTVMTSVADSLVKIGQIDGGNLWVVGSALPILAAGLLALGAAELINGIMGFISSLFGGGGPTIWEKLMELGKSGPGLMQAASAVSVLAPAFAMLSQVDDGENLGALMDNLKSALKKLDDKAQATMKGLADSMYKFGQGAYALGLVRSNPNLELLATQIQTLLSPTVTDAITKGTPVIQGLQTTLNSFNTSTRGLADSLAAANPQLMMLLNTMNIFSQISAGIDLTTMALTNMATALSVVSRIDTSNLTRVPWKEMSGFSQSNGNFVVAQSANNNFNITQDTAKNIDKMATNTEAMVKLTNTLVKLTKEGFFGGETSSMKLYIDGKDVNSSMKRYKDNTKKTGPGDT